jgi:hypothetical protein
MQPLPMICQTSHPKVVLIGDSGVQENHTYFPDSLKQEIVVDMLCSSNRAYDDIEEDRRL